MKNKRKKIMLKIFKLQLWITTVFFLAYVVSIIIGGKDVFLSDLDNKKRVAGATVSAMIRIFGPPEIPIVAGMSECNANGNSIARLSWPLVVDAISYDVYRNGIEIENGLVDNFFVDKNVFNENSYAYYVIASGPAGNSISDVVTLTTKKCLPEEENFVEINTFEGRSLSRISGVPNTKNKKPSFSGLSNFENATIEIEIFGEKNIFAKTLTNENGFWQWKVPTDLSAGEYDIYLKAFNPSDNTIIVNTQLHFKIKKEAEDSNVADNTVINLTEKDFNQTLTGHQSQKPFDFDVSLENEAHIQGISVTNEAYRGESIKTSIKFNKVLKQGLPIEIEHILIDPDREIVGHYYQQATLVDDLFIERTIPLPANLKLGKYSLKIIVTINGVSVSNESFFKLIDKPLLKIGATTHLSYNNLVDNLSWLFIISAVFLSFFSMLALWEHHLYKQALFHITEKVLKRKGFIK